MAITTLATQVVGLMIHDNIFNDYGSQYYRPSFENNNTIMFAYNILRIFGVINKIVIIVILMTISIMILTNNGDNYYSPGNSLITAG